MSFSHPRLLWMLWVVPALVVAYALDGQRRRRLIEHIGHRPMIQKMIASASTGRRRLQVILSVSSIGLLALSLARPQVPGRAKLTESRGLDLVAVLDFSKSMLARDVYPSRLERVKAELGHFLDGLHGDRVGLVAFAGETMEYPLTLDYEAAKLFWRDLMPTDMPLGGTDLGRAIRVATELLLRVRTREGRHRPAQVILLLTDGEDTEGSGIAAAKAAGQLGIRVYALGVGSAEHPFVQLNDGEGGTQRFVSDETGQPVRMGLDEVGLQQIASSTGGDYMRIDPQRFGTEQVQRALASLERTEEEARVEREPEDVGHWFFAPAFLLLVASGCTRERKQLSSRKEQRGSNAPFQVPAALLLVLLPYLTGFDLFMRRDPDLERGNRLLAAGRSEEALAAYDRAVEEHPEEPITHFDRGGALFALQRFAEAQKEFQKATETHDQGLKADAYYNMGNALYRQERWREALDAYKRTLGLRSDDRRAKWNLELAARKIHEPPPQRQEQTSQGQKNGNEHPHDQGQTPNDPQNADGAQSRGSVATQIFPSYPDAVDEKRSENGRKPVKETEGTVAAEAKKGAPRDIDRQDAEAVLDALERVEPTVQKDLAHRRAGARRPSKDW